MNLKLRLNLIITTLLLFTVVMGAITTVDNARENVRVEIASTAILALNMLDAEIALYNAGGAMVEAVDKPSLFRLKELKNIRHLRIDFYNADGQLKDSNQSTLADDHAPKWFVRLMDTVTNEMPVSKKQVFKSGYLVGEVVVSPDPSYEIYEVWNELESIVLLLILFFIVVNILIYYFVARALRPIDNILLALTKLEQGDLSSRLPTFTLPELSKISDKFNVMAGTLEESIANNRHLTQQMIKVQEDERKNLARELHDEIGQHLTAIHIDASAILKAKTIEASRNSASAIDEVACQMMDIVRNILRRLRPSGLDELGLESAVDELVSGWQQRHPNIQVNYHIRGDLLGLSETLLITTYRIMQECLTNISRHAKAQQIDLFIIEDSNTLFLYVGDDGLGFDLLTQSKGFGLAGIRERVDGLEGRLDIITSANNGTKLNIELPILARGKE